MAKAPTKMMQQISTKVALPAAAALTLVLFLCGGAAAVAVPAEFIRSSCKVTRYPNLCERCLFQYAPPLRRRSPRLLARAALVVTANGAQTASAFVRRLRAGGHPSVAAVRDCIETLADGVDRLRQSVKEMERMGRYGSGSYRRHIGNVQTWVSAALTDQNTCLDSLSEDRSGGGARLAIGPRVVRLTWLTSNALALINQLDPQMID